MPGLLGRSYRYASWRYNLAIWRQNLLRIKQPLASATGGVTGPPQHETWRDIAYTTLASLAGPWTMGFFVIFGQVTGEASGPVGLLAVTIAAGMTILSGLCLIEFRTHSHRTNSSIYSCTYMLIGELPAFLIGWLDLLSHVAMISAVGRSMSGMIDYLTGSRIQSFVVVKVGPLPVSGTYPDFLAIGVAFVPFVMISLGLEESITLRSVLSVVVVCAILFFNVMGLCYIDLGNWKQQADISFSIASFLPGVATYLCGFFGIYTTTQVTKVSDPSQKSSVISTSASMLISFITYFISTLVLTFILKPTASREHFVSLEAFTVLLNGNWIQLTLGTLAIFCLSLALLELSYPLLNMARMMCTDGLLPRVLLRENSFTGTRLLFTLIFGALSSAFAFVFDTDQLLYVTASSVLLLTIQTCVFTIYLRYRANSKSTYELLLYRARQRDKKRRARRQNGGARREKKLEVLKEGLKSIPKGIMNGGFLTDKDKYYGVVGHSSLVSRLTGEHCDGVDTPVSGGEEDEERLISLESYTSDSAKDSSRCLDSNSGGSGYLSDGSSDTDIDAIVEEYREKIKVATVTPDSPITNRPVRIVPPGIKEPSSVNSKRVNISLSILLVLFLFMAMSIRHDINNASAFDIGLAVLNGAFIVMSLFLTFVIAKQPPQPSSDEATFRTPFVPWVPMASLFMGICIFVQIIDRVYVVLLLWILAGLFLYFFYGMKNSTAASKFTIRPEAERVCFVPPSSSSMDMISSLVQNYDEAPEVIDMQMTSVDSVLISR